MGKKLERRPFHETIVDSILAASGRELEFLATLIKATKIVSNHDNIIAAWNKRRKIMCWSDEHLGVPASILEQKTTRGDEKFPSTLVERALSELSPEENKMLSL